MKSAALRRGFRDQPGLVRWEAGGDLGDGENTEGRRCMSFVFEDVAIRHVEMVRLALELAKGDGCELVAGRGEC